MRLLVRLAQVMNARGIGPVEVARVLDVNRDQVAAVRDRSFKQISRRDLQALWTWTRRLGVELLDLEDDPIWQTFTNSHATFFLSSVQQDARIMSRMIEVLEATRLQINRIFEQTYTADQIVERMQTQNCIFLGGPRHNRSAELAYAKLYEADPDDPSRSNCDKLPARFAVLGATDDDHATAAVETTRKASDSALLVRQGKRWTRLSIDYIPEPEYEAWAGQGIEGGVLTVCRRPLGATANVTTIIIAGFTTFSSEAIAEDLIWEMTDFADSDLEDGRPATRILRAPYRKRKWRAVKETVDTDKAWFVPEEVSSREWRKMSRRPSR